MKINVSRKYNDNESCQYLKRKWPKMIITKKIISKENVNNISNGENNNNERKKKMK